VTHHLIRAASTKPDIDTAAALVGTAFTALEVCAWLVPDPQRRTRVLTDVFAITVAHAVDHGSVQLLTPAGEDQAQAVAVWFDLTRPVPEAPGYAARLQEATGADHGQFLRLDEVMEEHHPADGHHYLAFLAVAPGRQRTGLGTALLQEYHADLDRQGLPAYLEASSSDSAALYRRHGYADLGTPYASGGAGVFTPLWRAPRTGHPSAG
jgi:ribosomal protein S18 acetylase RimI-like enzyme